MGNSNHPHPAVGGRYTYNRGEASFIVLYVDDRGDKWGLVPTIVKNKHGAPAVVGHFNVVSGGIFNETGAGLMRLPNDAALVSGQAG